jgi:hypothetical protein
MYVSPVIQILGLVSANGEGTIEEEIGDIIWTSQKPFGDGSSGGTLTME